MVELSEIINWLDKLLNTKNIPDYPNAHNGLQVENDGHVSKVCASVDASLNAIKYAAENDVDLLIVHHGLYWQGVEMLQGAWKEKCKLLLDNNIAIYSSHIPLDIHPTHGNNALLAQSLGLKDIRPCIDWKGIKLGLAGKINIHRSELSSRLETLLDSPITTCLTGEEHLDEVHIITGGAGSELTSVNQVGGKNFITGEGSHWNMVYAEENEMNLFLAKHYLTETFGVKSLTNEVKNNFNVKNVEFHKENNFL